ncbi:hypothetical protein HMPREF2909_08035 [Alloscardovia sp. HMSC034E08]|nr:hypothetical protein HMPREF2909_08035 [Alloscardovia sp. HMSC034E08]
MVVAVAMIFSGLITAFPMASAQAASTLPIAQYVKTSGTAVCATDTQSATYNGTVNINVPLSTVMSSFESDMETAATSGYYPHSKDAPNTIAYIEYSVTFPENVAVGTMSYTNNSTIISKVERDSTTGSQEVKLKMYLIDQNWNGIYKAYNNDKQNPSAHTVNITIPYTVTANSKQQAQQFEAATIAGSGSFEFWGSVRLWGFLGNYKYVSDNASQPLAAGMSACFPDPVKKTTKWVTDNGEQIKDPVVSDDFQAAGTIDGYEFIKEVVSEDGNTKTYTFKKKVTNPTDAIPEGTIKGTISADLSGSADGNNKISNAGVFTAASKESVFSVTGTLHVNDLVKGQMAELIKKYDEKPSDFADISLSKTKFQFVAKLTLPEGLEFADAQTRAPIDVALTGAQDFEVKSAEVEGKVATVVMGFKKVEDITTFAKLKEAIDKLDKDLSVTVNNITFSDTAYPATNYSITGEATGGFSSEATKDNTTRAFNFEYTAANEAGLLLTVNYAKPIESDLPADVRGRLSVADGKQKAWDTTAQDIYRVPSVNDTVDVQGVLHVGESVKAQMKEIENKYGKNESDFEKIKLDAVRFGFQATLKLPEGMKFTTTNKDDLKLEGAPDFDYEVSFTSNEAVVDFVLKDPAAIKTYADLKKVIDKLDADLTITIPRVGFDAEKAKKADLPWFTIEGTASGNFSSYATFGTTTYPFTFQWNGKQKQGEEDRYFFSGINFTVQPGIDMPADLRGAQTGKDLDTEHEQVYVADSAKSTLDVAGVLHIQDAVIAKMKSIENWKGVSAGTFDSIVLKNTKFGFDAKLTLPEGMTFTNTDIEKLDLVANGFVVNKEKSSFDGNVLTVHFGIAKPEDIKTYGDLKKLVNGAGNDNGDLMITVHDVAFTADSKPNTNYTIEGTVAGEFSSEATLGSQTIPFAFQWNGIQQVDEADAVAPQGINFTVKYKADPTPELKPEDPKVPTKPVKPTKPNDQKPSTKLARTGAAIVGIVVVAGFAIAAGVSLVAMRRMKK